jgi:hypothetical protein
MLKSGRSTFSNCVSILSITGVIALVLAGNPASDFAYADSKEKPDTMDARLQRLEAREEIRLLLMDYGRFLDQRDFESFSQLFAEKKGEWIGGMGKATGPHAIRKLMEDTIGKNTNQAVSAPNCHLFTNEVIHVNGDTARATTKWIFAVQGEAGRPQLFYIGHYEDSIVREKGRWKFLRRVVYGDIPADNPLERK